MTAPVVVLPKHVQACQHSPSPFEKWFIWTWKRGSPSVQTRIPYSCNSWRCEVCRRHEAAVTFARIKQATDPLERDGWVYAVLTLDRNGYYSGEPWPDVTQAYRALGKMSTRFLRQLRRRYSIGNQWVAVVEAHRSGWPHMNLMIYCPELAAELRAERERRELAGATVRETILLGGELLSIATTCGWGRQSTIEAARDTDALAGYIVKLAGNHDASVGELAKITQAPTNAPERFRRLRSGQGFLPPRYSNPEVTGCLVRRRRSAAGDWQIMPINPPKDPEQVAAIATARSAEHALIEEEESILSRRRGRLPAMPPLRLAVAGVLQDHRKTTERNWQASLRQACA